MKKAHVILIIISLLTIVSSIIAFVIHRSNYENDEHWLNNSGDEMLEETIFNDVSENHWASEYIEYLSQRDIMLPYDDDKFYPDNFVELEEFIEIIIKVNFPRLDFESLSFEDMIKILENSNVLEKGEITSENLNDKVTNYSASVLLAKLDIKVRNNEQLILSKNYIDLESFDDVGRTLIGHAVKRGFAVLMRGENFYPNKLINRAEVAQMVYLYLNK